MKQCRPRTRRIYGWRSIGQAMISVMLLLVPCGARGSTESAIGPGYLMGPEDVLFISVWKDEHLTREAVVRPDGMISFPLVGDLPAEGRTVDDLRADLVKRLSRYIPNANVTVAVTKVLSYKVYVVGRVTKPGEYLVGHYTDVLQALSLAGGLTPFAAENDSAPPDPEAFRTMGAVSEHLSTEILEEVADLLDCGP